MNSLAERLASSANQWDRALQQFACSLRVAMPAIVTAFDPDTLTVSVRPAIKEPVDQLVTDSRRSQGRVVYESKPVEIPLLEHVPILIPRAGGFMVTVPVQAGDECLVVFADMNIGSWWQSGGVQAKLAGPRHSLFDGFAILGCWSQPNKPGTYSTDSLEVRSYDGATSVEVKDGQVKVTATAVDIVSSNVTINGRDFMGHQHSGVQTGGGQTGGVV